MRLIDKSTRSAKQEDQKFNQHNFKEGKQNHTFI